MADACVVCRTLQTVDEENNDFATVWIYLAV
jgi:hypothetical protein